MKVFAARDDAVTMSQAYAEIQQQMLDAGKRNIVLTADFTHGMGLKEFAGANPDRFLNMGIAEQNMASFAAGLAEEGFVPFIHCFGVFASRRMLDQLYISCAYARLNVKVVGADPGYTSGHNGGTHMAMEDTAILRAIPQALIVEPCDAAMLRAVVPMVADYDGFAYMRLYRGRARTIYEDGRRFTLGKAVCLREGSDMTLIACGQCVADALSAADRLAAAGIQARVLDMFTIKPLDIAAVNAASSQTGLIVTVENASASGGLGGAVAEALAGGDHAPVVRMGRGDVFGEIGTPGELKARYRLTAEDIYETALTEYRRRKHAQSV